jgi:peptidoglycan/xylan/chitin deacetylase (PgdA/CDA1 family)
LRIAKLLCPVALTCGVVVAAGLVAFVGGDPPAYAASCGHRHALGTSRTLVIEPTEHVRLGAMQYRETLPLARREVVLTFDDGPLPPYTTRVLDVLAAECVKATFFLVGRMARNFPRVVSRIAAEGHTIGTHSQTHPFTFNRISYAQAGREVEGGIASVSAALGGRKPAPFFRIPGLLRASPVETYLANRKLMTWSADIPSDDWRRISDKEIVRRTMARLDAQGRGMILLHDIRPATALALPVLLRELKRRGYRVVHVVPATRYRQKTATLPSQWRVRRGYHEPQIAAKRASRIAKAGARTRLAAKTRARRTTSRLQRQAAGERTATARVAVLLGENDPAVVRAFQESSKFFSGLFGVPRPKE